MRLGAGPNRTRDDHLELAAQLYALVAEAQHAADLADVVGADALSESERAFLTFRAHFESDLVAQGRAESRTLDDTLDRAWGVVSLLPRQRLSMLSEQALDQRYKG